MSSLKDKILKAAGKKTFIVSTQTDQPETFPMPIPALNIAHSGDLNVGMTPGILQLAAPSKHFKTLFALIMAKAYLDKYADAYILFFNNEYGVPDQYYETLNIDRSRIIRTDVDDLEEFKTQILNQLESIEKGDHAMIIVDSIGNIASNKELEDARKGNTTVDMTRAKVMKSVFRMITPIVNRLQIPMVIVNHTYETMEMYSKQKPSGGTGPYYSADDIWIIGRRQEKDGKDVSGYQFIINIEKSRRLKEKSQIPITVSFDDGIQYTSGLMDIALNLNVLTKVTAQSYQFVNEDGELIGDTYTRKVLESNPIIWKEQIAKNPYFNAQVVKNYQLGRGKLFASTDDNTTIMEDITND